GERRCRPGPHGGAVGAGRGHRVPHHRPHHAGGAALPAGGGGAERYALPMHSVVVAQAADETEDAHAEGRPAVWVGGEPVTASRLATVLERPESTNGDAPSGGQIVVVAGLTRRHAFHVDGLVGQRDVVVKGLSRLLPRLDVLAGASVEPDGSILLVLDAPGLIDRARRSRAGFRAVAPAA